MAPPSTNPHVNCTKGTFKCVYIPDDGSPAMCPLPLSEVGSGEITQAECNSVEKELKRIPNIISHHDDTYLRWEKRQLYVSMERGFEQESLNADYYMYTCMDGSLDLSRNSYLERIQEGLPADERTKAYGIAFLFKTTASGPHGRGEYIDMTQDFVEGLRAEESPERDILLRALMEPQEMDGVERIGGRGDKDIFYETACGF